MTQEEFNSLRIGDTIMRGIYDTWVVRSVSDGKAIITQTVVIDAESPLLSGLHLENKREEKENHILENVRYLSSQLSAQIEEWEKSKGVSATATPETPVNHITDCKVFIHEPDVDYGHRPMYVSLYIDPKDGNTRCGRCHEIYNLPPSHDLVKEGD